MPLSSMAAEDIKDLQAKGVVLSPAQIVRLNELGLQVENGPEAAAFCHAPRVAWADESMPLFEPTIQSEMWFRDYALLWWHGASVRAALAWSCAHSTTPGFFADKITEKPVRKMVQTWFRGLACTSEHLDASLTFVLSGVPVEQPETKPDGVPDASQAPEGCPYTDLLNRALAAGLGASHAVLSAMPRRVLRDILQKWMKHELAMNGGNPADIDAASSNRAYCAYDDYLIAITPKDLPNV